MKKSVKFVALIALLVLSSVSLIACKFGGIGPAEEEQPVEEAEIPSGRFFGYQHGESPDGQVKFFHSFGAPLVEEKRESADGLYKIK